VTDHIPRTNRIDPFGDIHSAAGRGLFTGNRGCLVDASSRLTRHHHGDLWITCVLRYRDWRSPLDRPGHWTPLFFLDDAVALAAGHRPCGLCRRDAYNSYRDAVQVGLGLTNPPLATDLNRMLARERLKRGRGLSRGGDRKIWTTKGGTIPTGTVILDESGRPRLVMVDQSLEFDFTGWANPAPLVSADLVPVLTPPTSFAALAHGFQPILHPSASV